MLKRNLYPHQQQAVSFLNNRRFALLADDMGLGKTLSALATTNPNAKNLVIAPKTLLLNWKNEIEMTFHEPNIRILSKKETFNYDEKGYVLVNFEQLKNFHEQLQMWHPDVTIIDESHYIKNISAERTKLSLAIASSSKKVICLTGTPLLSRVEDLFIYFVLAGKERPIKRNLYNFLNTYSIPKKITLKDKEVTKYEGLRQDTKQQLISHLKTFTLRRRKKDILSSLPPIQETIYFLKKYKDYDEDIDLETIAKNVRLAQHVMKIRHETALKKAKDPLLLEFIKDMLDQTDKIVIFAHHKDVIEILKEKLSEYNPLSITGQESAEEKHDNLERFKHNPTHKVLILSILAAGVGLNITNASYAIFVEMDWNYANMEQAKARLHRIGQQNAVNVYYAVYDSSIDHLIAKAITEKQHITVDINQGIEHLT